MIGAINWRRMARATPALLAAILATVFAENFALISLLWGIWMMLAISCWRDRTPRRLGKSNAR